MVTVTFEDGVDLCLNPHEVEALVWCSSWVKREFTKNKVILPNSITRSGFMAYVDIACISKFGGLYSSHEYKLADEIVAFVISKPLETSKAWHEAAATSIRAGLRRRGDATRCVEWLKTLLVKSNIQRNAAYIARVLVDAIVYLDNVELANDLFSTLVDSGPVDMSCAGSALLLPILTRLARHLKRAHEIRWSNVNLERILVKTRSFYSSYEREGLSESVKAHARILSIVSAVDIYAKCQLLLGDVPSHVSFSSDSSISSLCSLLRDRHFEFFDDCLCIPPEAAWALALAVGDAQAVTWFLSKYKIQLSVDAIIKTIDKHQVASWPLLTSHLFSESMCINLLSSERVFEAFSRCQVVEYALFRIPHDRFESFGNEALVAMYSALFNAGLMQVPFIEELVHDIFTAASHLLSAPWFESIHSDNVAELNALSSLLPEQQGVVIKHLMSLKRLDL
jgi:hypothetical protein